MGKSRVNKKTFGCGHRGFGQFCHRCAQADKVEALLKEGKPLVVNKKNPRPKKLKPKQMREILENLRKVEWR